MATLIINSLSANPIRLSLTLNGQGYTLEYPNKQAALDVLEVMPDAEAQIELALMFILREWRKTDPNLINLAGLLNKTCAITLGVIIT